MANENTYFVGQGEITIRKLNDDGTPAEAFWHIGDANELTTDISVSKQNHYESQTGTKVKSVTWNTQTDSTFSMAVQNFNADNLRVVLSGTDTGAVAGASVVDEIVEFAAGADGINYTVYQGITAVSVNDGDGVTPLVEGTDYEIEAEGGITGFSGGIRLLVGAPNYTGPNIEVSYTHVGVKGVVEALTTPFQNYEIRFNAVNMAAPNSPLVVKIAKAQLNPVESIGWISDDIGDLTFTGDILKPVSGAPIVVTVANEVA